MGAHDLFLELQAAVVGRYSLERELGRGGMGIVYLARDVMLDRAVAIKVLPPDLAAGPGVRERFLREARVAAGLSHPNIVPIHAVEEAGRLVYFVMAYVPGRSLGERIRVDGPLAAQEAGRILREVAWALGYAHQRGVIHRDVKADNIILLDSGTGRSLVVDFGITAVAGYGTSGAVTGTVPYMSPEQAKGAVVDGRSDLYSLGVVGYLALAVVLPYPADRVEERAWQRENGVRSSATALDDQDRQSTRRASDQAGRDLDRPAGGVGGARQPVAALAATSVATAVMNAVTTPIPSDDAQLKARAGPSSCRSGTTSPGRTRCGGSSRGD